MTTETATTIGVAILTIFMVIALATIGVHPQAPAGQIAQQTTVQSAG